MSKKIKILLIIILILVLVIFPKLMPISKYDMDFYACDLNYKLDEKCDPNYVNNSSILFWSLLKIFPYK